MLIVADNDHQIQARVMDMMEKFGCYFSASGFVRNPDKSDIVMFRTSSRKQTRVITVGHL